jgi:hypothetical protein
VTDAFGGNPEEAAALKNKRYHVLVPGQEETGQKAYYSRVTTFVKAVADNIALERWKLRKVVEGIASDETLYLLAAGIKDFTSKEGKEKLDEIIALAQERAGANEGSRFGTALHAMNDLVDTRDPAGLSRVPTWLRPKYVNLARAYERHRLAVVPEFIERRVFVSKYQLVGTLDRILLDEVSGDLVIADLKTQARLWGYQDIAIQLALYANADYMWDPDLQLWEPMPDVRKDIALMTWMPRTHPSKDNDAIEIEEVRIDRAWEFAAQVCADARAWRTEGAKLGSPRPLPNPVAPVL